MGKRKLGKIWKNGAWRSWWFMKQRVLNSARKDYPRYKNYFIDPRWLVFENFYNDMGDRPKGLSIDRIDNSKGYYKENCRWATPSQQASNRKQNVKFKSKLSPEQVKEIRKVYKLFSTAYLAEKYNVSRANINCILRGETWKGVA